jgi:tetratricopeptide (TPR) repeat protein
VAHRIAFLGLLASSLLATACLTPAYETDWVEVESEHFEIASSMDAEEAVALANDLETFRSAIQVLTNAERFDPLVPTRIYAFRSERDFSQYAPPDSAGFFQASMRGFTVALYPDRNIGSTAIIQHEFTHLLMQNQDAFNYPLWFHEGFAELFGAMSIVGDQVRVGFPPEYRMDSLRYGNWVPIEKVVATRSLGEFPGAEDMFYAESWALVHYLQYGREDHAATTVQMPRYLSLIDAGASVADAWRDAFGGELGALDRILKAYLKDGVPAFGIPAKNFRPRVTPRVRALSRGEVASDLGWLSLTAGDPALAERSFGYALVEQPDNARAHAGMGDACKFQNRWEEAEPHYQRALALAPDDALNHLEYAEYLHDLATQTEDAAERQRLILSARRHYVRSQKLDRRLPETYAMYGSTFLMEGEDPSKGLETLEHAHAMLRTDPNTQFLLAQVYARTGRIAEARDLLETLIAWAHDEEQAEVARELLAEVTGATRVAE